MFVGRPSPFIIAFPAYIRPIIGLELIAAFAGHFGACLGHTMELEGPRWFLDTGKSTSVLSVANISVRLAIV